MTWLARGLMCRAKTFEGGERRHHGAEHCALKNIAPESFTALNISERASMGAGRYPEQVLRPPDQAPGATRPGRQVFRPRCKAARAWCPENRRPCNPPGGFP